MDVIEVSSLIFDMYTNLDKMSFVRLQEMDDIFKLMSLRLQQVYLTSSCEGSYISPALSSHFVSEKYFNNSWKDEIQFLACGCC